MTSAAGVGVTLQLSLPGSAGRGIDFVPDMPKSRRKHSKMFFFSHLMVTFSQDLQDLNIGSVSDSHNVTTDTQPLCESL